MVLIPRLKTVSTARNDVAAGASLMRLSPVSGEIIDGTRIKNEEMRAHIMAALRELTTTKIRKTSEKPHSRAHSHQNMVETVAMN